MTDQQSERDLRWLYATPTGLGSGAWFVTIHGFDIGDNGSPPTVSMFWPQDERCFIPNKMVMMTVAEYADLVQAAKGASAESK